MMKLEMGLLAQAALSSHADRDFAPLDYFLGMASDLLYAFKESEKLEELKVVSVVKLVQSETGLDVQHFLKITCQGEQSVFSTDVIDQTVQTTQHWPYAFLGSGVLPLSRQDDIVKDFLNCSFEPDGHLERVALCAKLALRIKTAMPALLISHQINPYQ